MANNNSASGPRKEYPIVVDTEGVTKKEVIKYLESVFKETKNEANKVQASIGLLKVTR